MNKRILDACCGSKMFWFDNDREDTMYCDIRTEEHTLSDGRHLEVNPDMEIDFRDMPFEDESFYLVVFDPPHLETLGEESWMAKKYGRLFPSWEDDITEGFKECFRVLKPNGVLIFKWNEYEIPLKRVLKLTNHEPLFGNKNPKQSKTHWIAFMK